MAAWLAVAFGAAAVVALPAWRIGSPGWQASRAAHDNFAEQVGWPELVAEVARVYHALPPAERRRTAILADNYGEAGAIDRYGPAHGLPRATSMVNSYWARGPGIPEPSTVIVLGNDADAIGRAPADCTLAGRIRIPHGVENEESGHPDVVVCRNLRVPLRDLWPPEPDFA